MSLSVQTMVKNSSSARQPGAFCSSQQHFPASQLSLGSPVAQLALLWLQMKQHNLPFGSRPRAPCCQLTPGPGPLAAASGSSSCFPALVAFHSQVLKVLFKMHLSASSAIHVFL